MSCKHTVLSNSEVSSSFLDFLWSLMSPLWLFSRSHHISIYEIYETINIVGSEPRESTHQQETYTQNCRIILLIHFCLNCSSTRVTERKTGLLFQNHKLLLCWVNIRVEKKNKSNKTFLCLKNGEKKKGKKNRFDHKFVCWLGFEVEEERGNQVKWFFADFYAYLVRS